jgi:hypothetical protein
MSIIDETRFIERLHFFDGQRLVASDLQGLEEFNREMRRMHNMCLHQHGVGSGFAVSGEKGDREVTIGPGYAIDSLGREIILTQTEVLAIPPDAGDKGNSSFYDLTVSYPQDSALEEAETRDGICLPRGAIRLREAPIFCWVELSGENFIPTKSKLVTDLQTGLKIRLARVEILNCRLNARVSVALRDNARPEVTPYVAAGFQQVLTVQNFPLPLPIFTDPRVRTRVIIDTIDTSAASFLATPEYMAHITGPRRFDVGSRELAIFDQFSITSSAKDKFEILDLIFLVPNRPTSLSQPMTDAEVNEVVSQISKKWEVVWMGVER